MDNKIFKIRGYYFALAGISKVFDDEIKTNAFNVEGYIVNEYEDFVKQVNEDIPGLLTGFDKSKYFNYTDSGGDFYNVGSIRMNIARNLGTLKASLDQSSSTPVTEEKSFHFVTEVKLRTILERDYQEIQRSIISLNWKSAIILSGGSIEAILLDQLSQNETVAKASKKSPKETDLNKWDLNDLIEVAVEEKLVNTNIGKLSHSVRDYRNLVHPGVEVRTGLKVEAEEAKIAVEILHMLIRELS